MVPAVAEVVEARWTKLATLAVESSVASGGLPECLGKTVDTQEHMEALARLRCEYMLAVLKSMCAGEDRVTFEDLGGAVAVLNDSKSDLHMLDAL
eukprot:13448713-Alexandrium_andersonii.AAC.1